MKFKTIFLVIFFLLPLISFAACGGDDDDDNDTAADDDNDAAADDDDNDDSGPETTGSAPVLTDLQLKENEFDYTEVKFKSITVQGMAKFTDDDGDLTEWQLIIFAPNGNETELEKQQLQGIAGATTGTLNFTYTMSVLVSGDYQIGVVVYDAGGNKSNTVKAPFYIVE